MTDKIVPNQEDMYNPSFQPTEAMQIAKSKFVKYIKENKNVDVKKLNRDAIAKIVGTTTFNKWRVNPEFRAWFFETDLEAHQLRAASELAIQTLVRTMLDDNPKLANARVKAAQLVLDYSGFQPDKKVVEKVLDKNIGRLSEDELKQLIIGNLPSIIDSLTPSELAELVGDKIKQIEGENI
jgi:hypothetical protein